MIASQNSPEKGRPGAGAGYPGAKLSDATANGTTTSHANHRFATSREQSTIDRGIYRGLQSGIRPHSQTRNLYAENAQQTSALRPLTTQELTKEVQCVVLAFSTRDVIDDTQASQRAIENIRNGESGMSLKTFVNLCRANARARAMVAPLLGYGDESDPNVVQAISVLLNQLVRPDQVATSEALGGLVFPAQSTPPTFPDDEPEPVVGDLFIGGSA